MQRGKCKPTFFDHPHDKALLEATVLAPVSPSLINGAVFVGKADVLGVFLNSSLQMKTSVWFLICNQPRSSKK